MAATRKNTPNKLKCTKDMCVNFCYLCNALSECCVLNIPCKRDRFLLQTDASGYGLSGILSEGWRGIARGLLLLPVERG